jgi:penicillin-binding protein 2
MKPHLVKILEDGGTRARTQTVPKESFRIPLQQKNIDFIKQAMVGVTREGTSAKVFAGATYVSGGKTGTAQVISIKKNEKYNASRVDERHRDHSLYTAFAPADNPKIALALIVENGGFGATAAAPIARAALDYYLLGKRSQPQDDAPPASKADAAKADAARGDADSHPLAGLRAEQESEGGPRAGGETQGNQE